MKNKVKSIMLVDDNFDDNFIHERLIRKTEAADIVIIKNAGGKALDYLKSKKNDERPPPPDLIFLDINMPGMNGWEFLDEYTNLAVPFRAQCIVVMLTTSENPAELMKSKSYEMITEFRTKPLTETMLAEVLEAHFSGERRE